MTSTERPARFMPRATADALRARLAELGPDQAEYRAITDTLAAAAFARLPKFESDEL